MNCTKCDRYSYQLRRCLDGRFNPTTIKGGVSAISVMGISYICKKSKLHSKIMAKIQKKLKEGMS